MRIAFDPRKDSINRAKHGLPLEFAQELAWDEALCWLDEIYKYDEKRMIALVPQGERLYSIAFVDYGDHYRIISLRRAQTSEVQNYVKNYY